LLVTSARRHESGGTNVRFALLALVAALVATSSFFGSPSPVVQASGADLLPSQDELNSTLAPFTIANYAAGPGKDGWDGTADFDINGAPDGLMHSTVDASELPSNEGAAGFLQTKLQQLRDGTRQGGFMGDVGPAGPELTMDADEAYWGVFLSPPSASSQTVVAIQISRYENQVIATTVMMRANGSGPLPDSAGATLGVITGQLLRLMNSD
jgi:hypothetical protein